MNTAALVRTFGNSRDYAPRLRIYADRWYTVTLIEIERDMGDGMYLTDRTADHLMPGTAARQCRDAQLNHCTRIVEHTGPVWEVTHYQHGHPQPPRYTSTVKAALELADQNTQARAQHIEALERARDGYRRDATRTIEQARQKYPAISEETHAEHVQWDAKWAEDCQRQIDALRAIAPDADPKWKTEIVQRR